MSNLIKTLTNYITQLSDQLLEYGRTIDQKDQEIANLKALISNRDKEISELDTKNSKLISYNRTLESQLISIKQSQS